MKITKNIHDAVTIESTITILQRMYKKERVFSYNDTHMVQHVMMDYGASDILKIELSQEDKEQLKIIEELKRLSTEMMKNS